MNIEQNIENGLVSINIIQITGLGNERTRFHITILNLLTSPIQMRSIRRQRNSVWTLRDARQNAHELKPFVVLLSDDFS